MREHRESIGYLLTSAVGSLVLSIRLAIFLLFTSYMFCKPPISRLSPFWVMFRTFIHTLSAKSAEVINYATSICLCPGPLAERHCPVISSLRAILRPNAPQDSDDLSLVPTCSNFLLHSRSRPHRPTVRRRDCVGLQREILPHIQSNYIRVCTPSRISPTRCCMGYPPYSRG